MLKSTKITVLTLLLLSCQFCLTAQQDSPSVLVKEYLRISNSYQWLPLQVEVSYKQYTNIPLPHQDTAILNGQFFVNKQGAYIKFGQMEQIVNDTLALVVMSDIKHMVLSENTTPVESFMHAKIVQPSRGISTSEFDKRYKTTKRHLDEGIDEIEIAGRNNLYGTEEASEVIHFQYDALKEVPKKITTIKRSLVSANAAAPESANPTQQAYTDSAAVRKITVPGKGTFLIKEEISVCEFKKITHDTNVNLPAVLSDRLYKDGSGKFFAAKPYSSYYLSRN